VVAAPLPLRQEPGQQAELVQPQSSAPEQLVPLVLVLLLLEMELGLALQREPVAELAGLLVPGG
jgi:hypothetical protein